MSLETLPEAPPPVPAVRTAPEKGEPRAWLGRVWTGFVGSIVEAWAEVRIHKTQVLLSLVGVGVAVTTLTLVVAAGAIATQSMTESFESGSGRPAAVYVYAYDQQTGQQPSRETMDRVFADVMQRYGVTYTSRTSWGGGLSIQFPDGVATASIQGVDQPYGVMHRIGLEHGSWFTSRDADRLAPAIVVSEEIWTRLGSPDLRRDPRVEIVTPEGPRTMVVVGVTPARSQDGTDLRAFLLNDDFAEVAPQDPMYPQLPEYEAWIPPQSADQLIPLLQRDISGALGETYYTDVSRRDYLAWGTGEDPLLIPKVIVTGIAILVMGLGALGLLNIALVTVRHRIREIGIRRAFGATAGRVFFAVMMESVVATFVAGLVGVLLAIVLVRNPITEYYLGFILQDIPGFPAEAALLGLGVATGVGALAGLLPALVAVRVKVIDAIRY